MYSGRINIPISQGRWGIGKNYWTKTNGNPEEKTSNPDAPCLTSGASDHISVL